MRENVKVSICREGISSFAKEVKEASHGGKVLLFTEEGLTGDDAVAALSFEGLKVVRRNIPEHCSESLFAELQKAPEGILAAAAVGGVMPIEAMKAAHIPALIPKILFPTHSSALSATDDRVYFGRSIDLPTALSSVHSVLLDPDLLSAAPLRPTLGYLFALVAEEADGAYEDMILRKESPASALRALKEKLALLSSIAEEDAPTQTVHTLLTLLKASERAPRSSSVHTLALLAARKTGGSFGDYLFPAGYALLAIYASYLGSLPLEHCPPPDRVENLRLLHAKCGVDPSLFSKRRIAYAEGYDDRWRVTAEYREDFLEIFAHAIPLSHLSRLYRRAPHEKESSPPLTASDLLLLLSLTGEAVSGYPLIKHIKMTGLIEPLLRCG